MTMDLRLPLGILFIALGAVLVVVGLVTPAVAYQQSLGININLVWGSVLLLFGLAMVALVALARRNTQ